MKFYLFNLTGSTVFVKNEEGTKHTFKLSVLPNATTTIPAGNRKFMLSSVGGIPEITFEKALHEFEVEQQYVINPSKKFSFRWGLLAMPEDCPWRIYREQTSRKCIDILILPKRP
ncbi:hypothetical protein B0F90DRAFT_1379808 [Multifurca ochricompacta]|uniref:Uncharacterized protein n=1 Tax=Multifurca ochricompacta TaxID=376703 RepID=A0AAD4M8B0_9AGAM|nr:hypothetical protein B0F90DRAFT_1379808 [Multifurca ochricompacta]